ncbi:hypothetical protein EYF80_011890 [Liparis tanakae]|uniref:Uncharacterized protein n=1 Tax=Liparis tanakae TaxID=230148 RepID=A0A4Z2IKX1_9TELE|nr:hypothetical protein EYF80_011890 [Liparis tanakae]
MIPGAEFLVEIVPDNFLQQEGTGEVGGRSLQEPPLPAFIVGHVGLDLVVLPLVSDQHAFDSRHLPDTDAHNRLSLHRSPLPQHSEPLPRQPSPQRGGVPGAHSGKGMLCIEVAIFATRAQPNANVPPVRVGVINWLHQGVEEGNYPAGNANANTYASSTPNREKGKRSQRSKISGKL